MKLLFLGVGSIALAVRRAAPNRTAAGTTRAAPDARFTEIRPISSGDSGSIREAAAGAEVLVSFPPDGRSDAVFAALVSAAASVVYLSSTAVYPAAATIVTERTEARAETERARRRLHAEAVWRSAGARVLRLPAFYGRDTGLHLSIARRTFRLPGDGSNIVSRVHVDDAARFALAAFATPAGAITLAGDDMPARVIDVVRFVCTEFELAFPPTVTGDEIPGSLRSSRAVETRATRERLGIELLYPSYHQGYRAISQQICIR